MDRRAFLLLFAATTGAAACGGGRRYASVDNDRLSRAEMLDTNSPSVYEAMKKLRPGWMTSRGPVSVTNSTPATANVYMYNSYVGSLEYLRQVNPMHVDEVRYFSTAESIARFGAHNPRGVIQIIPRK